MEQVLKLLERVGYPKAGIDWLREQRASIIVLLALLSWAGVALAVWCLWLLVSLI
jgi:hypothetical protein